MPRLSGTPLGLSVDMEFTYTVSEQDYRKATEFATRRDRASVHASWAARTFSGVAGLFLAFALTAFVGLYCRSGGQQLDDLTWLGAFLAVCIASTVAFIRSTRAALVRGRVQDAGPFPVSQTLRVDPTGISLLSELADVRLSWSRVRGVEDTGEYIVLHLAGHTALAVPVQAYESVEAREAFKAAIQERTGRPNNGIQPDAQGDARG